MKTTENKESYCTFKVGQMNLGIAVKNVQEVFRFQKLSRVPLSNKVLSGLMNLRGQIVTTIDLRQRFELPAKTETESPPMNVVIRTADGPVSLLVDEIDDVVEVAREHFEHPPETLKNIHRQLITGAFKLEGRLLLILDTERAISIAV